MRSEFFGNPEARDTVRKGAKIINEYINAGWRITSPEDEVEENACSSNKKFEQKTDETVIS